MSATYPQAVRQFSPKQDYTGFILAAHVNDLQDEVAALQRALGIIPFEWDNGNTTVKIYQTVKSRMDDAQNTVTGIQAQITSILAQLAVVNQLVVRMGAAEANIATLQGQVASINSSLSAINATLTSYGQRLANLEAATNNLPQQLTDLQNQVNALKVGLAADILNTGQVLTPDPYQWNVLSWNGFDYDNAGIYSGGSTLVCPQDGWWLINCYAIFPNTRGGATGTNCEASLELRINGNGVVSDRKELELGIGGSFGLNTPYAGRWFRGSTVTAAVNFNPYNGSAPALTGRISFTRLHGL
jgi:prefoldin subunit 5